MILSWSNEQICTFGFLNKNTLYINIVNKIYYSMTFFIISFALFMKMKNTIYKKFFILFKAQVYVFYGIYDKNIFTLLYRKHK